MNAATIAPPRFETIRAEWDHNGSFHVTVRDNESAFRTAKTERRARDTARRVDPRPDKVQWTRLDRVRLDTEGEQPRMVYHFTVSRLDRSYR